MNEYVKNLKRIEFVVTMECTGRCKHCSEGEHENCRGHIEAEVARIAIRELCENYNIESLMTFGGEALLYPEVVCMIHRTAMEMRIRFFFIVIKSYLEYKLHQVVVCG